MSPPTRAVRLSRYARMEKDCGIHSAKKKPSRLRLRHRWTSRTELINSLYSSVHHFLPKAPFLCAEGVKPNVFMSVYWTCHCDALPPRKKTRHWLVQDPKTRHARRPFLDAGVNVNVGGKMTSALYWYSFCYRSGGMQVRASDVGER